NKIRAAFMEREERRLDDFFPPKGTPAIVSRPAEKPRRIPLRSSPARDAFLQLRLAQLGAEGGHFLAPDALPLEILERFHQRDIATQHREGAVELGVGAAGVEGFGQDIAAADFDAPEVRIAWNRLDGTESAEQGA